MVTCKIIDNDKELYISIVYAKSSSKGREELWNRMRIVASTINAPWAVAGDFNSILDAEEKIGGNPHRLSKSIPFMECLSDCGLRDSGYTGHIFTWCNERKKKNVIWKGFQEVVKSSWKSHTKGNIFWEVQQKLKNTSSALSSWSKNTVGDIFKNTQDMENRISELEQRYIESMDSHDRMQLNKAKAELISHHKKVNDFWKQKANLKGNLEGDENTKYFHSIVKGRRNHLQVHRILENDVWVEGEEEIGIVAENFYRNLFSQ
ncbi:uncharacterized protein LOC132034932 [Lycium ferocissimum]|uniref:uncharacterized protein LOC132034932 n=1 Tax=Lycium ferocissimum TaxID=112874 RepID=UPI0028150EEB|nr:uncharacterized protein LOC132034932 [Lycium ferocissimum]